MSPDLMEVYKLMLLILICSPGLTKRVEVVKKVLIFKALEMCRKLKKNTLEIHSIKNHENRVQSSSNVLLC